MRRLLRLPFWLVPGLCIAIALVVTVRLMMPLVGSRSPAALREVRLEEQEWRKRVRRLQQWPADAGDERTRPAGGRTLDELRLTLLETLERAAELDRLSIDDVSIEQQVVPGLQTGPGTGAVARVGEQAGMGEVTTLRLALDGELPHAGHLLAVLERLSDEISSFPAESRGCSVERMTDAQGIRASCLFDVYYWDDPWLLDDESVTR